VPPPGRRFDYVHLLLDCVPQQRRSDLIRHHLASTVRPGTGRVLVSNYSAASFIGNPAADQMLPSPALPATARPAGGERHGRPSVPTAWIDAPP